MSTFGTYEPPVCDHPQTIDERRFSDADARIVCVDCGLTLDQDQEETE